MGLRSCAVEIKRITDTQKKENVQLISLEDDFSFQTSDNIFTNGRKYLKASTFERRRTLGQRFKNTNRSTMGSVKKIFKFS